MLPMLLKLKTSSILETCNSKTNPPKSPLLQFNNSNKQLDLLSMANNSSNINLKWSSKTVTKMIKKINLTKVMTRT